MRGKAIRVDRMFVVIFIVGLFFGLCLAEDKPGLGREREKDSYSLGYQFGANMKRQPLDLDLEVIIAGIRDAYEGKDSKLSAEEMKEVLGNLKKKVWVIQQKRFQEQAARNLKEGEAFLAENAKKDGVITLPSGLQYKVLKEGDGQIPKSSDTVKIYYRGTLINGTEFDSSYGRNEPASVPANGIIKGWKEALQLMKVGSKWQVFVPAKLAYGERQFGRIPPNSTLIFEIELLSIGDVSGPGAADPKSAPEAPTDEDSQNPTDRPEG